MNASQPRPGIPTDSDRYLAATHEVVNQPPALENYNLYEQDVALQEAVKREGAGKAESELKSFGAFAGEILHALPSGSCTLLPGNHDLCGHSIHP